MNSNTYCGNCGQSNPEANSFCGKCGLPLAPRVGSPADQSPSIAASLCPICKRDDQIRKLSSITSAETRTTSGETHSSGRSSVYDKHSIHVGDAESSASSVVSATELSELARRVGRPTKPPEPSKPNNEIAIFENYGYIVVGVVMVVVGSTIGSQLLKSGNSMLSILLGCSGAIVSGILTMALYFKIAEPSADQKRAYQEQMKTHEKHLQRWEEACRRWERTYYCYRDDVVFLPGKPDAASPNRCVEFCYQETGEEA